MLWIGLTGGIASGKSTVSKILSSRGYDVVDADVLAREAVRPGTPALAEIAKLFGPMALETSGELNRKKIGELVFSDKTRLAQLEAILHPRIRELADTKRKELSSRGKALAFYDVPLLFEKDMRSLFDAVVVVTCAPSVQMARMVTRDDLSLEEAELRLEAQMPIDKKSALADFLIQNDTGVPELEIEVDLCLKRLLARAHQAQT